ncbi:MAG: threonine--tRNA ligase, partial [Candidatus Magasanikbacteria bacterium CG10_big_fil_rev_8_21_14_0_10_38_6]
VVYGAVERFLGVLLESSNGNLPTWLNPIQVRVLSFTDRNKKAAEKIVKQFKEEGIRVDIDLEDKTVQSKVRDAEIQRISYIIVIGDKEEKSKTLAVRTRGEKKPKFGVKIDKFISDLKKEIEERE